MSTVAQELYTSLALVLPSAHPVARPHELKRASTALSQYEAVRDHSRMAGASDAIAKVIYEEHRATSGLSGLPWEAQPMDVRERWRRIAWAVLFSGIVTA